MSAPSPLISPVVFHLGPVPFTEEVVTTWGIIAVLGVFAYLSTRRLAIRRAQREPSEPRPRPGRLEVAVEAVFVLLEDQIRGVLQSDPAPLLPFIGTLFLFLAVANLSSLLPGVTAPTGSIETPAALALIVFFAVHAYGIRAKGLRRYLAAFAQPSVVMLPLNILSEITRTFALMVRLFGNIMSHEFIIGILVSLVGLLVPIPFMALGILIGLIQAYIFAILATVFIGAAMETIKKASPEA
jgi:F-type H+-transporting ATPase subunit a